MATVTCPPQCLEAATATVTAFVTATTTAAAVDTGFPAVLYAVINGVLRLLLSCVRFTAGFMFGCWYTWYHAFPFGVVVGENNIFRQNWDQQQRRE